MKPPIPSAVRLPALALLALLLAACSELHRPGDSSATQTSPSATAAPAAAPAAAMKVLPHGDAVLAAANALFTTTKLAEGANRVNVVIDPLVDGVTGEQSTATVAMGQRIGELARSRFPQFNIQPFQADTLAASPLVLVGTFTPVNSEGKSEGDREAFRICLALADLKTGKIVGKGVARSQIRGVNTTPTPYFRDSPAWVKDPRIDAYIRTCQGSKAGDPIPPAYLDGLLTASIVSEAIQAYNSGRYRDALERYEAAAASPAGLQLRVLNGLYLVRSRLGPKAAAEQAFTQLVDFGLETQHLGMKFLFRPGSTAFVTDSPLSRSYGEWLRIIAQRSTVKDACLEVSGHTSRTGPAPLNERLSQLRAEFVRNKLIDASPALATRTLAVGMGFSQPLVGTGRDDASDALDRRVVFSVIACQGAGGK